MKIITRKQAKAQGLPRFYSGKPCKYGHRAERYTSNYICVECNNRKIESKPRTPAEPELDYSQIGKSIVDHMNQLKSMAGDTSALQRENDRLTRENSELKKRLGEKSDQIEKLNRRITQLNESKQRVPSTGKFTLGELTTFK